MHINTFISVLQKNRSILKELEKITRKSEKYPFIESNIIKQKNQLNNIVRSNGFYFAKIDTQIIENKNSYDLIYNFDLGKRVKINEISLKNFGQIRVSK